MLHIIYINVLCVYHIYIILCFEKLFIAETLDVLDTFAGKSAVTNGFRHNLNQ